MMTHIKPLYECGPGWDDLIEQTIEKMRLIDPDVEIMQVKEKFGELRIYFYTEHDYESLVATRLYDLVEEATKHSLRVCEDCGLPGQLSVRNFWLRTSCESHLREGGEFVEIDETD